MKQASISSTVQGGEKRPASRQRIWQL